MARIDKVIVQNGKVLDADALAAEKDRKRARFERQYQGEASRKAAAQAVQAQKRQDALNAFNSVMNPGLSQQDFRTAELNLAKQAEQTAQQRYEDYKQSDQRKTDWDKAIREAIMEMPTAGSSLDLELGKLPEKTINQTEAQHEAVANYYEQNRKATEDRHMMEDDVAEVEAMSNQDRRLLETYAYGRNEWFDHQKIGESVSARVELEKKYGKDRVEELAESWQRYQNMLSAEKNRQQTMEGAGSGFGAKVGHSAASVAANAIGSLTAPFGYLQEAFGRTGRYQTLDPNNVGATPGQYASAVREAVSEDMGTAGKVLYHGTMGALDNLARVAMGGGTKFGSLGLAALGSFGSTLSEASAQGATPGQAVGKAVLSAGIEVATEYVPLDELFKAGKSGYKGAKAAFKQALKQGGIEAAEEEIALLGNLLVDAAVMQEKSAYNQQIGELVANGMSYADAKNQADRALWDEAANTALTSFVSGGVMSGAQSGAQYVGQRMQDNARYKAELNRDIQAMMQREAAGNATQNATAPENATVSKMEAVGTENATTEKPRTTQRNIFREASGELLGVQTQDNTAQRSVNESAGIKQQIQASQETLASMEPAAQISTPREFAEANVNGENAPQGAADGFEAMGAETGGFGDNAENALYKSLGAAGQKFKHEVRRSKVYDNTYKNATDPEVKSAGEKAVELDPKIAEYDYISEEESVSNARDRLNAPDGLAAELEYLTNKQGWTGEDNDTAMLILKQLQKSEDTAAFKALARAQKAQGTSQGQFVQSFAKYSRDATRAAVDAVEMLDNLGKGDVPKKFWKKNSSFDAWKDDILKSTMEIANDIEAVRDGDAEAMRNIVRQLANFRKTTAWWGLRSNLTKNAERILRKMDFNTAKDIACAQLAKIPDDFRERSKGEIIKTVRYNNMLSSLVTVNRNLIGNATMGMIDAFSDATAGRFADMLMANVTGKRTVGNDARYLGTYFNAARDAGDMAALMAELDIPAEHEGKYTGRTRTFSPKSSPLGRFMSAYEKYMNYALQVSDEFFSGGTAGAVSKSLEALGTKSGLSEQEIAALGDRVGRRRTFKEGRKLAKASAKVKKGLNEIGTDGFGLGDMALSFAETPAEMGQVAIDYSGTGLIEGLAEMASIIKDVKNGKAIDVERQRKAVSDFGRGMTGVGLIAAFTAFAAAGLIAVHDDEDKDKRGLEQSLGLSGAQFNLSAAVRWAQGGSTEWQDDDLVMSIDFLQPFNSQMYIGYLLSQEEDVGEMMKAYPSATFRGIAQSVLDIPMMQTFSDLADLAASFGEVSEGDFSAVTDAAGQLIGNQAGSFIPAWMRQTAQYIDPIYRDTTGEDAMDAAKNRIMSGLPFLSQKLPAKYDGLGNLQTRYENPVLGFFNTFINPGAFNRIQANEIADKLEQLGDKSVYPEYLAPKSFQVDGETVMVSGKEMTETYQKTYGDNIAALYGGLMETEDFQKLTKEQQIAALKQAKTYATQLAKAAVSDYADAPEGTSADLMQDILQKQAAAGIEDALDGISQTWKDGGNVTQEALSSFTDAVLTYDKMSKATQKAVAENASGALKRYIEAKGDGIGAADFLNLYEASVKTGSYRNFDLVTDGRMDVSAANDIVWMLEGVIGTGKVNAETGKRSVRDIDQVQAIADGKGLTDKETETAIRLLILDDKQEEKLDNVLALGYDIDEYADFYQVQVDNGKKDDFIAAIEAMGLSKAAATELYYAFNPKK